MEASKADLDLAEIRERANNATPGPWEADRPQVWGPNGESVAFVSSHDPGEGSGQPEWDANTVFIAHAREDVPALLDALQAVRKLHKPRPNSTSALHPTPLCSCGTPYPCPTIQAIEGGTDGSQ